MTVSFVFILPNILEESEDGPRNNSLNAEVTAK